jgi:hypothetical protein
MSKTANLVCGLVLAALIGCGHKEDPAPTKPQACAPGTGYSCYRNGCNGHQRCLDDGSAFTSCECDSTLPKAGQTAAGDDAGPGSEGCDSAKGLRCSPAAPSDWQGPVAFRTSSEAIACASPFEAMAFAGGDEVEADPASCSSCSCEAGSGCGAFIDFRTGDTAQCGGDLCTTSVNQSCAQIAPSCLKDATSAYLQTSVPSGSGCKASTQHANIPEARWKTHALACRLASPQRSGCQSDELCLPAAISGGFEDAYCIWREGDQACPKTTFTRKRLFHRAFKDTRECSACSCSATDCQYRWRIFNADDTHCTSPLLELSAADQCVQVNPESGKLRVGAMISGDSSTCSTSGGESLGEVAPDQPVTVCCSSN